MTRIRAEQEFTAWHEAGHVIVGISLGIRFVSSRVGAEDDPTSPEMGRSRHDTLRNTLNGTTERDLRVMRLAGDAVSWRRGVREDSVHMHEVIYGVGQEAFEPLWSEAKAAVDANWSRIERFANKLLSAPGQMLGEDDLDAFQPAEWRLRLPDD